MNKNYVKLDKHQNIYKNTKTKRYLAIKKIKGKQFSQTFDGLRDAIRWRHAFNGLNEVVPLPKKKAPPEVVKKATPTLSKIWEHMRRLHFSTLEIGTVEDFEMRFCVLKNLHHLRMEDFTPSVLDKWLEKVKAEYLESGSKKRCSFKNELKLLGMIFSWYRNEPEIGDYKFVSPILKRHGKNSVFRERPTLNKKITPEDVFKFIRLMPPLYRDLALFQYFTACRIGEAAGIQIKNIDLEARELVIKDCCVWNKGKKFHHLKPYPKNKHPRYCHISGLLKEVIERRLAECAPNCDYLFHKDGKPLGYRWIQHAYVKAQKEAGVAQRSTHVLRHGMATLARKLTRSLDATMAMTGHKDMKMADHYSEIGQEVQKETTLKIETHLKQLLNESASFSGCTEGCTEQVVS